MQLDATGLAILVGAFLGGVGALSVTIGGLIYGTMLAPMRERLAVLESALEKSQKDERQCAQDYAALKAQHALVQREVDEQRIEIDELKREIEELKRANRTRSFTEEDRR